MPKPATTKYLSLRVERPLLERFRIAATANRRSQNDEVRYLIERRVEEFDGDLGEAA